MPRKNITLPLLAVIFIPLFYWVGSAGLASFSYLEASHYLEAWHGQEEVGSDEEVSAALKAIRRANALHSNHPHYLNTYANILLWRSATISEVNFSQKTDYRDALALYKRSAELRPLWPDTWSAMAMTKWRLNEFDEKMLRYIARADQLGPFSPSIHDDLVKLGFALQQRNPFTQHAFFKRHLLRGLESALTRKAIVAQVELHEAEVITCRWLKQAQQVPPRGMCSA